MSEQVLIAANAPAISHSTTANVVLDVQDLRKQFRRKVIDGSNRWSWLPWVQSKHEEYVAVKGVSFEIRRGEIFGLLGPNGAGKSTTIRMISTLLQPSSGSIRINGFDVVAQPSLARQNLGAVLAGDRSIYWKLTARENLEYFAALYHIPPAVAKKRVQELLERLDLANRADEQVERYSTGMKQRVAIGKALLANPPVVLLDEPTLGLDPQSALNLRELIREIKAEGRTILLTTHYMEEADVLCDRIGIIDQGQIIALDTSSNLKRSVQQFDIIELELEQYDQQLAQSLEQHPQIERATIHQESERPVSILRLHCHDSSDLLGFISEQISSRGNRLRNFAVHTPSLEDVFLALTGKQLRD
jgi:ABC-2 type transport system ATP-binding protein